jgi:hypothetical protein
VVAADWDGDGRFDLLSGCDDGGVYLFRNTGKTGAPTFAAAQVLVPPHVGIGYEELQLPGQPVVPGIRAQITVCDYNGDGKLDLLLGDFRTTRQTRPDLPPADLEKVRALLRRMDDLEPQREKASKRIKEELRKFWEPIPVKEQLKPEVQKKYRGTVQALQKSEWYRKVFDQFEGIDRELQGYLAKPDKPGLGGNNLSTAHGYVWLYLRR